MWTQHPVEPRVLVISAERRFCILYREIQGEVGNDLPCSMPPAVAAAGQPATEWPDFDQLFAGDELPFSETHPNAWKQASQQPQDQQPTQQPQVAQAQVNRGVPSHRKVERSELMLGKRLQHVADT